MSATVSNPVNKAPGLMVMLRKYSEWIIPTGAVALVFVMLVPLPGFVPIATVHNEAYFMTQPDDGRPPDDQ